MKHGYETYMFLALPTYTFWQYTDGNGGDQPHQVPGIGRCDRDKFNSDQPSETPLGSMNC